MKKSDKFSYRYTAPTEEERREIESIRRAFAPESPEENKLERLRRLSRRACRPARIAAAVLATAGILLFGLGMSLALSWQMYAVGVPVALVGAAIAAIAYPVHTALLRRGKRLYGAEILALSEELLPAGTDD